MSSEIAIKVENLSKCYQIYDQPRDRLKQFVMPRLQCFAGLAPKQYFREFWALKDVFLEVKKGETVGIIGRNGSGKSTLLQMICGTLSPTSGGIEANGRIAALLELGSGFNPEFTGRENIYTNAAILGLSQKEADARFDEIAAFAEIGKFIDQPFKTYSSGMQLRLAFSVATCVSPSILIIDEALGVGDAAFQFKCAQKIKELTKDKGATLLFVSHDIEAVRSMAEHVVYLRNGEIRAQGMTSEVTELYLLDLREDQRLNAQEKNTVKLKKTVGASAQAFGTDQGRITAAFFLGGSNHLTVEREAVVRFSAELEYDEGLYHPEFTIYIQDRKSVVVGGTSTKLAPAHEGGGLVKFNIECSLKVHLNPGIWFVTLVLRDVLKTGLKLPIDKQVAALELNVTGDDGIEYIGLSNLDIKTSLTTREVA